MTGLLVSVNFPFAQIMYNCQMTGSILMM